MRQMYKVSGCGLPQRGIQASTPREAASHFKSRISAEGGDQAGTIQVIDEKGRLTSFTHDLKEL